MTRLLNSRRDVRDLILAELRKVRRLLEREDRLTPVLKPAPRLLTVPQAAEYLGCSVWAMRDLHWKRDVRAIRIGRRLLFDRADLDKYVDVLKRTA